MFIHARIFAGGTLRKRYRKLFCEAPSDNSAMKKQSGASCASKVTRGYRPL